jgi:hypothetical protein
MRLPGLLSILFLNFCLVNALAQEVTVRAELDTNRMYIGDPVKLRFTVEKPVNFQVDFPYFRDSITNKIEVLKTSPTDTLTAEKDREVIRQDLTIAVYDTGFFVVPPVDFVLHSDSFRDTLRTSPVTFEIVSLKTDSTIRDIKAIYSVPFDFRSLLPYVAGILVFGALLWLLLYYVKKRQTNQLPQQKKKPEEPADVTALRDLELLNVEKPWQHNRVKVYYIRLSEILRTYIEGRFHLMALEQTTDEILTALKPPLIGNSDHASLKGILRLADLVKFAKVIPAEEENAAQVDLAIDFVKRTALPDINTTQHA